MDNDNENKKLEVIFAAGCFDDFEGTQEELDDLMKEILRLAESGELTENAELVNMEDFGVDAFDDLDEDYLPAVNPNRNIH